ncbi:MAG TPA: cytochrome c biogenesis protein CcsA [Herpetosiphonaceae bacterium]|nr:cytochrome c biogenesis protein CcsA [Herpetosiphonaceae bacterium]
MYYLGSGLIIAAIGMALASSLFYLLVIGGRTSLLRWGRATVFATLGFSAATAALILALFLLQRYDIRYVYDYSSRDLDLRYRIAATWAGQPGSLVVWALAGLCVAPFLIRRTRHFEPYVLALLMLLQVALLSFMLIRNPFMPTLGPDGLAMIPEDGRGLNPQLHNVWMVIHPPTLFTGYGLMGVPFAFALAGLWRRDYDGWVRLALPWTLAAWGILGLALTMGGYWAYESLGWGGYWGWDPVENSSLVPWLIGAALMHGMVLQKAHGGLRRTNFVLAILTYLAVFYASFLTRSGVLSNFSVHSFTEAGLKEVMLVTMVGLLVLGAAMVLLRWRDVPTRPLSESFLSRDTAFVLLILGFLVVAAVIAVGTSLPWISSAKQIGYGLQRFLGRAFALSDGSEYSGSPLTDGRFSLTADFFERTTPPLGLVLVLLASAAPLFGWRDTNRAKLLRALRWPALGTLVLTAAALFLGVRRPMALGYVVLASFAVGSNLVMIVRTLRSGWLRIGGYLSHVGAGVLLLGVVGSYAYASEELRMVIPQGETQRAFGHGFTFWGYDDSRTDGRHGLRIEVDRDGDAFVAQPEVYYNGRMGAWTRTPAIKRYLWRDLYVSPEEYLPATDPSAATMNVGQEKRIGPYALRFDGFDVKDHLADSGVADVGATVTITETGKTRQVQPRIRLEPGKMTLLPVDLGDGKQLVLDNFVPATREVLLRVQGLNLPVEPARAVIQVSTKPAISLVWLGALLIAIGTGIAAVRRRIEINPARERARQAPERQPERVGNTGGAVLPGATFR